MANKEPRPGRCNHKFRDTHPTKAGLYCANKPAIPDSMGGNGWCKFHGGFNHLNKLHLPPHLVLEQQQAARTRHGLYSTALAGLFRTAKHQLLYADESTARVDLTPEIRLWRTKCYVWQELISKGQKLMETDHGNFRELEEILARGTAILARLIETQRKLHPEADANGELTVRLVMEEGTAQQVADLDMPDLEAGATQDESPAQADPDLLDPTPATPGPLDEFADKD